MEISDRVAEVLGLTDLEHQVLEYLSEAKSLQQISSGTGFSRTGVKYALETMEPKGFVQKIKYGKRYLYISITKNELSGKLQEVANELLIGDNSLKGIRLKTSERDEFIIHIGKEEILPTYKRIASTNKGERIKAIQHHKSYLELLDKITSTQLDEFNNDVIKNNIIVDGMLNESAYDSYKQEILKNPEKYRKSVKNLSGRMADYTVFPDKYFNVYSEIWIFKETTLIIDWRKEIAIEIINKNMTSFIRDMFEFVKMGGKKIDHNKMIQEILEK